MAGRPNRSGGTNALAPELHVLKGTYQPSRHNRPAPPPVPPLPERDRRKALKGLPAPARKLAAALLEAYGPWDAANIVTLRAYVLSAVKLETLRDDDTERRKETRTYLALLGALNFEK